MIWNSLREKNRKILKDCCSYLPVAYLSILILVSKLKHLVNILFLYWYWQVTHHELEVCLGEVFVLNLVFLSSEVCWIRFSPTNCLKATCEIKKNPFPPP